jgi:multidrug efflux pump subunit AcrB
VDLERAANDVRDKVSQALGNLPQDIDAPPTVSKADSDSDPILFLQIQSQSKGLLELTDYAENVVQERLANCFWRKWCECFWKKVFHASLDRSFKTVRL